MNSEIDLDDDTAFLANLKPLNSSDYSDEKNFGAIRTKSTPIIEERPIPEEFEKLPLTKRLCTVDIETDPFLYERVPKPFWVGFYDGETFTDFWGDDCIPEFFRHLEEYTEELVIYAHNGGKFDFHFFLDYMDYDTRPFLINGRIVKVMLQGQEFRDSFAIIPVALEKFNKLKIDYTKFEKEVRNNYASEIREYARVDVISLYDVVKDFIDRFGWRITIASTALPLLHSFHGYNCLPAESDKLLRPFYRGGRVECFGSGILYPRPGHRFVMIDRNSMYPTVMHDYLHPVSALYHRTSSIDDDTDFACIEAESLGSLGYESGLELKFGHRKGKFNATIHEIRAGLETDTLKIHKVYWAASFYHKTSFSAFVDHFYSLRMQATANGDKAGREFYKLILNSAYGKFAQSTSSYKDWLVNPSAIPTPIQGEFAFITDDAGKQHCISAPDGWSLEHNENDLFIFSRPKRDAGSKFINVATAASITGAARADLWRAICACRRPLYCDTDSIICEVADVELGDKLGQWKIEATGDAVCIAGKKMYAFLGLEGEGEEVELDGAKYKLLKKANKGVQLTGDQIANICSGQTVEYMNAAPSFSFTKETKFVKRVVGMTGDVVVQGELF